MPKAGLFQPPSRVSILLPFSESRSHCDRMVASIKFSKFLDSKTLSGVCPLKVETLAQVSEIFDVFRPDARSSREQVAGV